MKAQDLRKKTPKALEAEAAKLREAIAVSEMEKYSTDDKNYKKQRNQRRDLARILTVLNEENESAKTDDKKEEDK